MDIKTVCSLPIHLSTLPIDRKSDISYLRSRYYGYFLITKQWNEVILMAISNKLKLLHCHGGSWQNSVNDRRREELSPNAGFILTENEFSRSAQFSSCRAFVFIPVPINETLLEKQIFEAPSLCRFAFHWGGCYNNCCWRVLPV